MRIAGRGRTTVRVNISSKIIAGSMLILVGCPQIYSMYIYHCPEPSGADFGVNIGRSKRAYRSLHTLFVSGTNPMCAVRCCLVPFLSTIHSLSLACQTVLCASNSFENPFSWGQEPMFIVNAVFFQKSIPDFPQIPVRNRALARHWCAHPGRSESSCKCMSPVAVCYACYI